MPLSTVNKSPLHEKQKTEENTTRKKRKLSSDNQRSPPGDSQNKKLKSDPGEMTDPQKKANFSSLSSPSNGFNRHTSPLVNSKPGAAKKLVIKNFKGRKRLVQ